MTENILSFERLECCPVCEHHEIFEYLRLPYCQSEVEEYLFGYYTKSRNIDRDSYARMFMGHDYALAKCARCGALFQLNRPSSEILTTVYDYWISSTSSGLSAASKMSLNDILYNTSEAIKLISFSMESTSVSEFPKIRVLDYGMGNGFFALALKSCLVEVSGSEFSSDRLRFGRESGIRTFLISDDLPENYFHLINTEQVMEHVPDPKQVISKLTRALAKGGILKISVPNSPSLEKGDLAVDWKASRYSRRSPMPLAPLEHLQYYPRQCRKIISDDHGLELVTLPPWRHIQYGNNWSLRGAVRNIGRAFFLNRMRNYFLLRKPL